MVHGIAQAPSTGNSLGEKVSPRKELIVVLIVRGTAPMISSLLDLVLSMWLVLPRSCLELQ